MVLHVVTGALYSSLGFLFGKIFDLEAAIGRKERRVEPSRRWDAGPVEEFLVRRLPNIPGERRRVQALVLARVLPALVFMLTFGLIGYRDSPVELTFTTGYLIFACLLVGLFLNDMSTIYPLIRDSRAVRAHSFCLDKLFLILAVVSGVVLSAAAPCSMVSFLILCICIPWGCMIEMALDFKTPMNLVPTFFSMAFVPLVPMALEEPILWWLGLIPTSLMLICSLFALRYRGIVFPVA